MTAPREHVTAPRDQSVLLSVRGITKRYAAPVLRKVDLDIHGGEVHASLGDNGAGKSTLSKIVNRLVRADSGTMTLGKRPYHPASKADAERCGVQMVQQELNLIPTLTVAENLFLNRLPRRFGSVSYRRLNRDAERALALVGLTDVRPDARVDTLGVGRQQLVEIAAALARDCRVLILDEPTAALTPREIDHLFNRVRELRVRGVGVIYISHRLDEIRDIADRATILRDGCVVGASDVDRLTVEDMIRQMLPGQSIVSSSRQDATMGGIALRVARLTCGKMVQDVSFTVRHGERLGIGGLVGSGRTELLRAISRADAADSGSVEGLLECASELGVEPGELGHA